MARALNAPSRQEAASLNPFKCSGTSLPPEILLAAKLLALLLLWLGYARSVPEPFLPFVSVFDSIGHPAAVRTALQIFTVTGALGILFNRWVRASCLLLGGAIAASVLSRRVSYYNNAVFCGAFFLMIGLHEEGRPPWLLRLQVVLVYLGAGLDKLLDPDWRSGQFFEVWTALSHHATYMVVKAWFPPRLLSQLLCWITIVTECSLPALFLAPRAYPWAILVGVAFHTALTLFTGTTFGFFYFAIMASYLAFAAWPPGPLVVLYDERSRACLRGRAILERLDFDRRFEWKPSPDAPGRLCMIADNQSFEGLDAVRRILLLLPVTYFTFVVLVGLGLTPSLDTTRFADTVIALVPLFFVPALRSGRALPAPSSGL